MTLRSASSQASSPPRPVTPRTRVVGRSTAKRTASGGRCGGSAAPGAPCDRREPRSGKAAATG